MTNMKLWNSVCKTDPKHTKKIKVRGGFTAIDAQYQRQRATEVFGPFGDGWGVKASLYTMMNEQQVLYTAVLWYMLQEGDEPAKYGEFPIASSISIAQDDWAKKAATDALTKGLSFLGFNADVFLGLFDDNKYVTAVAKELATPKAAVKQEAKEGGKPTRDLTPTEQHQQVMAEARAHYDMMPREAYKKWMRLLRDKVGVDATRAFMEMYRGTENGDGVAVEVAVDVLAVLEKGDKLPAEPRAGWVANMTKKTTFKKKWGVFLKELNKGESNES